MPVYKMTRKEVEEVFGRQVVFFNQPRPPRGKEATKVNKFELRFVEVQYEEDGGTKTYNRPELWIDGLKLDEPWPVDLRALERSLEGPGEFFIFTCGCGHAACANIQDGIFVRHEGDHIHWTMRRPVSADGFDGEADWRERSRVVNYFFRKDELPEVIRGAKT